MPYPTELKPDGIDLFSAAQAQKHTELVGVGEGIPLEGLQTGGQSPYPDEMGCWQSGNDPRTIKYGDFPDHDHKHKNEHPDKD